jgi:citrate lyase subunit beta/citryl-CoA lyase
MKSSIGQALSFLFVPGSRPERFEKALASGASCIILDLEDAVAAPQKPAARQAIAQWLAANAAVRQRVLVRLNDAASPWHAEDLVLCRAASLTTVMLPKCESGEQVAAVRAHLAGPAVVLALIESARGIAAAQAIAATPGVARLAFGSLDYMVDLDIPALRDARGNSNLALDVAAAQLAIASRAADLAPPVAGVTPEIDALQVEFDMQQARQLGFGAKMCIHPSQVAAVHQALRPDQSSVAWAHKVLQAWHDSAGGAIQVDGKMVDRPVVLKAQRLVALAVATDDAAARPEKFPSEN